MSDEIEIDVTAFVKLENRARKAGISVRELIEKELENHS